MTSAQRRAMELMGREGAPVSSRRLAGEFGLRPQDAGRTLESLRRDGVAKFVTEHEGRLVAGYVLTGATR